MICQLPRRMASAYIEIQGRMERIRTLSLHINTSVARDSVRQECQIPTATIILLVSGPVTTSFLVVTLTKFRHTDITSYDPERRDPYTPYDVNPGRDFSSLQPQPDTQHSSPRVYMNTKQNSDTFEDTWQTALPPREYLQSPVYSQLIQNQAFAQNLADQRHEQSAPPPQSAYHFSAT